MILFCQYLKLNKNLFVNFFALLYNISVEENKKIIDSKKSKKNKKLIITLISVAVGIVLALTACLLAVFLSVPSAGGEVEIKSFDHQIFVKTNVKEDERTYRFKFKNEFGSVEIDSDSNLLDITQKLLEDDLRLGSTYDVSVCLVEPSGILAGEYGKTATFTPSLMLKAPLVSLNEDDGKTLSWQPVEYADYYNVCYYNGSVLEKVAVVETEFDTTAIMGGNRQIFVTSNSNRIGLNESEKSNVINVSVVHELKSFLSGTVDGQTKQVSIISNENVNGIVLIDEKNSSEYRIIDFIKTKTDTGYIFSFNIGLIFTEDDQTFLVKPIANSSNTFAGEPIRLTLLPKV